MEGGGEERKMGDPEVAETDAITRLRTSSDEEEKHVPEWQKVRDALIALAVEGNDAVDRYGDVITDRGVCMRFLKAHKGKVHKAVDAFKAHLEWRVEYGFDNIVTEDFDDLKKFKEVYWGGRDLDGTMTLIWRQRKHDARRTAPSRFVRFFIHQLESGLRSGADWPNTRLNLMVDLAGMGYNNVDQEMYRELQPILVNNYPKVRKVLYVYPLNWFVEIIWNAVLRSVESTSAMQTKRQLTIIHTHTHTHTHTPATPATAQANSSWGSARYRGQALPPHGRLEGRAEGAIPPIPA